MRLPILLSIALLSPAFGQADELGLSSLLNGIKYGARVVSNAAAASSQWTPAEEEKVGAALAAGILSTAPLSPNVRQQKYVSLVGAWVASSIPEGEGKGVHWRFGVLATPEVNSYATPGGYIFITQGLLSRLRSEAELAGVLGHEIGHVLCHHHVAAYKKAGMMGVLSSGAALLTEDNNREQVSDLAESGKTLIARGLDKDDEFAADRYGAMLAARAGYDPYGFVAVLQRLGAMSAKEGMFTTLLQTHPPFDSRVAKLNAAMGEPYEQYGSGVTGEQRFLAAMR